MWGESDKRERKREAGEGMVVRGDDGDGRKIMKVRQRKRERGREN